MGSHAPLLPTFASLTKKMGFRRQPSGLGSRSELGLKELHNSRNEDKNGPSLVGETVHQNYSMDKRRKEDGNPKIAEGAREKDVHYARGKRVAAESSAFKKRQKSTSKTRSLSSSEPSLWKNSLFNKFRNFAWHKRRSSHFELSNSVDYAECDPWSLGRLQRPAIGSCVDMKSRPDICPQPQGPGKEKFPSQPSEMDSVWSDLVPSTSLDTLHFWVDKSFSISHSSLNCPTASKIEEETSEAPKSFSENVLEDHLKSETPLLSIVKNSENLSDRTGSRKSGHFGKGTGLKSVMAGPHVQWPPEVAEDAKTTLIKNPSIIRYEIMITMTKSEEDDIEAKPTAGCGEQSSPCHSSGKAALSLGVAEFEKTEGQRHQKPARPASWLSACKEFQNCNRLHGVETCQVCSLIGTPATKSLAVPRGLTSSPREGVQRNGADPGHSQNGTSVEGKGNIALETSANRYVGKRVGKPGVAAGVFSEPALNCSEGLGRHASAKKKRKLEGHFSPSPSAKPWEVLDAYRDSLSHNSSGGAF